MLQGRAQPRRIKAKNIRLKLDSLDRKYQKLDGPFGVIRDVLRFGQPLPNAKVIIENGSLLNPTSAQDFVKCEMADSNS